MGFCDKKKKTKRMENLINFLLELGYKLKNNGEYYSSNAAYRNGSNPTALTIYHKKNLVIDWVTGERFNVVSLIARTLNIDENASQDWLKNRNVIINIEKSEPAINEVKTFPPEWLNELIPDHSYWMGRGISEGVLKEFKGGVWTKETMFKDYYVFPIFNCQNKLVGLAGRNINQNSLKPKWKLKGEKKYWKYPLFLNHKCLKHDRKVVLVESIGNCLALWEIGYKNIIVMFGIDISFEIINYLLKFDINNIIIATDNDQKAGKEAAEKIYKKLGKYFDRHLIKIILPPKKDFGEQSSEENKKWLNQIV